MFTSRAEYRLRLRQDNADLRLTGHGRQLEPRGRRGAGGCLQPGKRDLERGAARLAETRTRPGSDLATWIETTTGEKIAHPIFADRAAETARASTPAWRRPRSLRWTGRPCRRRCSPQLEIDAKYAWLSSGRQDDEIARLEANERIPLPPGFDYDGISGLSNELKEKLRARRPATLAEAARVPGVTPAALSMLLVHAKRGCRETTPSLTPPCCAACRRMASMQAKR